MNPSTAQAMVIVDELVRNDVRHVVVCPGSRNAPLSVALFEAARDGRLRQPAYRGIRTDLGPEDL